LAQSSAIESLPICDSLRLISGPPAVEVDDHRHSFAASSDVRHRSHGVFERFVKRYGPDVVEGVQFSHFYKLPIEVV
jgi:hypothetical protein